MAEVVSLLTEYTFQIVALGAALLGITSGILGSFVVLRKESLLGDGVSHAALPGVVLAFLLLRTKQTEVLLLGAIVAGLLAVGCIRLIVNYTNIRFDGALALVLSVFFGLGMVLLTYTQKLAGANQAGLKQYIFGQASTILARDVYIMAVGLIIICFFIFLFWKELMLATFDPDFAMHSGFSLRVLESVFTVLMVMAIVMGIQMVGVILMSSMLVAPGVAARQWTDRLSIMVCLATIFGAVAGIFGTLLSSLIEKLPTGAVIVLTLSAIVLISMLLAPKRGLIWRSYTSKKNKLLLLQTEGGK